jgi:flagellar hook protein FlgE
MGLAGARNSAVSGLQAQSSGIAISADNIANAATVGFKAIKGAFSTLVTDSGTSLGYSSGGVNIQSKALVEAQGLIEATGRVTDIAISGNGFFAVQDGDGQLLLSWCV